MDDVVVRLRGGCRGRHDPEIEGIMREAADEIERLRAALAEINRICYIPTPSHMKAYTHFQRDFDRIRELTAPFRRPT